MSSARRKVRTLWTLGNDIMQTLNHEYLRLDMWDVHISSIDSGLPLLARTLRGSSDDREMLSGRQNDL